MAARASGPSASRVTATEPKCSSSSRIFDFVICSKSNRYRGGINLAGLSANATRAGKTAAARAADLLVNAEPFIFSDTSPRTSLAVSAEELLAHHRLHGTHP